ncbi:hypothetical protein HI914_00144 [Erysiphe necator]|nr:hypothetical protein HI914_00144 [Erysiphe necator]
MTTQITRSSRHTNGPITSKIDQRHKVTSNPETLHSQQKEKAAIIGCKKRRQKIPTLKEESTVSRKRTKLKAELNKRNPKSSCITLDSKPEEEIQCSTLPSKTNDRSNSFDLNKIDAKTITTAICQKEALKDVNFNKSISENSEKDHKWKLRSRECSRFKSELSAYFPEYDIVIGNKPQDDYVLNVDTPIVIYDSTRRSCPHSPTEKSDHYPLIEFPDTLFADLHNAEKINLTDLIGSFEENPSQDILCESYFKSLHKRPYRAEKTIRNTDRERAQHDRVQVTRLLEGLRGHDWLRLLGVHGVPESKKREYESARQYFIRGCESILAKFQAWRDKEKRQKIERDVTLAAEVKKQQAHIIRKDITEYVDNVTFATKQNLHESIMQVTNALPNPQRKPRSKAVNITQPLEPNQDLTSIDHNPRIQENTLKSLHRPGRIALAWGYPISELPEQEFKLPDEFWDERFLRAHARKKRLVERVKKHENKTPMVKS